MGDVARDLRDDADRVSGVSNACLLRWDGVYFAADIERGEVNPAGQLHPNHLHIMPVGRDGGWW